MAEEEELDPAAIEEVDTLLKENTNRVVMFSLEWCEFIGGATDLFDVGKAGDLEEKLQARNIPYNETIKRDPYSFLPDWLHPG